MDNKINANIPQIAPLQGQELSSCDQGVNLQSHCVHFCCCLFQEMTSALET